MVQKVTVVVHNLAAQLRQDISTACKTGRVDHDAAKCDNQRDCAPLITTV